MKLVVSVALVVLGFFGLDALYRADWKREYAERLRLAGPVENASWLVWEDPPLAVDGDERDSGPLRTELARMKEELASMQIESYTHDHVYCMIHWSRNYLWYRDRAALDEAFEQGVREVLDGAIAEGVGVGY